MRHGQQVRISKWKILAHSRNRSRVLLQARQTPYPLRHEATWMLIIIGVLFPYLYRYTYRHMQVKSDRLFYNVSQCNTIYGPFGNWPLWIISHRKRNVIQEKIHSHRSLIKIKKDNSRAQNYSFSMIFLRTAPTFPRLYEVYHANYIEIHQLCITLWLNTT